jgi:hypothetical protein
MIEECPAADYELLSNTQCSVPVATLRASPFDLQHSDAVVAKVIAVNVIGESEISDEGSGASIFVPVVPDAPKSLSHNPSGTSMTTASFSWSNGASNGGKPVLDYLIEFNLGGDGWT